MSHFSHNSIAVKRLPRVLHGEKDPFFGGDPRVPGGDVDNPGDFLTGISLFPRSDQCGGPRQQAHYRPLTAKGGAFEAPAKEAFVILGKHVVFYRVGNLHGFDAGVLDEIGNIIETVGGVLVPQLHRRKALFLGEIDKASEVYLSGRKRSCKNGRGIPEPHGKPPFFADRHRPKPAVPDPASIVRSPPPKKGHRRKTSVYILTRKYTISRHISHRGRS